MAVVDKYVDADVEADKKASAIFAYGQDTVTGMATVAIASGDDDGSVYRVFSGVPSSLVPINIAIHNTAITAGTDYDLGLYEPDSGAVVDKDILADGLDLSSAVTIDAWNNVGLTTIAIASGGETLGEVSAQTDVDSSYDIALTANTVGSASGTIRVTATFAYK